MRVLLAALLPLGLVLETAVFSRLTWQGAGPDLLLIGVVCLALLKGARPAAGLGFIYGLAEDLLLGRYMGLNALTKCLAGYLAGLTESWLNRENPLVLPVLVLAASLLAGALYLVLAWLAGAGLPVVSLWPEALYNTALSLLFSRWFRRQVARQKSN